MSAPRLHPLLCLLLLGTRTLIISPHVPLYYFFFFFNDTATTEIYTLSLHDALPICVPAVDLVFGSPAIARVGELVERVRRSEEHTSELQSQSNLVCRLLLEKKKNNRSAAAHRVVIRRHWGLIGIAARSYETVISDHS